MVTIADFAKFILSREPQTKAERLALYHFLKNNCEIDLPMTSEVVEGFFRRALGFPHWQENRESLWAEVMDLLGAFRNECGLPFQPHTLLPLPLYELITIKNLLHLSHVVERYLGPEIQSGDQFRILPDQGQGVIAIHLKRSKELVVTLYDRLVSISKGQLIPLRQDRRLVFGPDLELKWDVDHVLEVGPFATARFKIIRGRAHGHLVKGYTFQKSDAFDGVPLEQIPKLFFALKRVECAFINREADPFYKEVVTLLEHASALVAQGDSEARSLGIVAFERGQAALDLVFTGDKVLTLLLKDLARSLQIQSEEVGASRTAPPAEAAHNSP